MTLTLKSCHYPNPPHLTRTEAIILERLRSSPGRLFQFPNIGSLPIHISHLRKKLDPGEAIVAVEHEGYRLERAEIVETPDAAFGRVSRRGLDELVILEETPDV